MSPSNSDRRIAALAALALIATTAASGCGPGATDYEGTRFACPSPSDECPSGHACVDAVCVPVGTGAAVDAGGDEAADSATDLADAEVPPPDEDAAAEPQTLTFGDRPDADVEGVTADTSLFADDPLQTFADDPELHIDADPVRVALLRFDLTAIPPSATVLSAELVVMVTNEIEDGTYVAKTMLEPWDEDTATWIQRDTGTPWNSPGAGVGSSADDVIAEFAPPVQGEDTVPIAIEAVQQWVDSPSTNFGMRWSSTSTQGRGGRLGARESFASDERPLLRVTFR
jgi:hypothetical protein